MPGLVIGSDIVAAGGIHNIPLIAPPPPPVGEITAVLQPATSPLFAGQSVSDTTDFVQMTDFANFTSSAGTVRAQDVSVSVLGDVADSNTTLNEGDMVRYQVTVTDDQGSAPVVFDTDVVTVEFAVRITSTAQNTVNIEVNPSIDPAALIDIDIAGLTAPDDIYNGTYAGIVAGTLAPGEPPFLLPDTFGLSHDGAGEQLDVGDTLTLMPGLALFPTGTPNASSVLRRGGTQIGAVNDLSYVVQAGEDGLVFDAVITLNDGTNADVVYTTNSFEVASVAVGPLVPVLVDNIAPTAFTDVTVLSGRDLSAASEGDRMFAWVSVRDNANDLSVDGLQFGPVTALRIGGPDSTTTRVAGAWFTFGMPATSVADLTVTCSEIVAHGSVQIFKVPGASASPLAQSTAINTQSADMGLNTVNDGAILLGTIHERPEGMQSVVGIANFAEVQFDATGRFHGYAYEAVSTGQTPHTITVTLPGGTKAAFHAISLESV